MSVALFYWKLKMRKLMSFKNSVLIHTRWKFILSATCLRVIYRKTVGVLGLPLTSCVPTGLNFRFPLCEVITDVRIQLE